MGYTVHTVALDHPSVQVQRFYSQRRGYMGIFAHALPGSFRFYERRSAAASVWLS
jgi:hypothetical protein